MKRLLPLALFLGFAASALPALAEEVKVLLDLPAPYTTDLRWFPDGRHLLLAHCAGVFSEEDEGNLPYGICRFLVFDTQTRRAVPVKLASRRGDWQDPGLVHLAMDSGGNCLWAVSPAGELYLRALPQEVSPFSDWPDEKGRWIVTDSVQGLFLYRYDPQSDRYYDAGPYDPAEDPLQAFRVVKIDDEIRAARGRRGGPILIPYPNPYSPDRGLAMVWDADYIPFESPFDSPVYEEVSLIRTSDRRRLYRVGGDRVLVSFGWDPRPGQRRLALLLAPRGQKKVFDPRLRRLEILSVAAVGASAGSPAGNAEIKERPETTGSFTGSDFTPNGCAESPMSVGPAAIDYDASDFTPASCSPGAVPAPSANP